MQELGNGQGKLQVPAVNNERIGNFAIIMYDKMTPLKFSLFIYIHGALTGDKVSLSYLLTNTSVSLILFHIVSVISRLFRACVEFTQLLFLVE